MRLDLGIIAGENTKKFLVDLEALVSRMEKAAGVKPGKAAAATESEEEEETTTEEEDDFTGKGKKAGAKKKGASFEDEEEEEKEDEEEEEEEETKSAKSKKAPKVDLDDVNDACKDALERLGGTKKARGKIVAILKDDFDCEEGTVTELKPDQYADVVKAMNKLKA